MTDQQASLALVPTGGSGEILFPGRGLPQQTSPVLRAFAHRYLDPIPYDPGDVERIRELSTKGVVVYTHRSANWVDLLFLQRQLPKHGLPHASYVAGFDSRFFHPIWTWFRRDHEPGAPEDPAERDVWRLEMTLRQQQSALVFLKKPATLLNPSPRQPGHFALGLIRAQRALKRPIFLVPQVIIWIHQPNHFKPTLNDVVFGSADSPGALRALGVAWLLYRWAKIRVALPVNVQEFLEQNPGVPDEILARKLRFAVNYHLGREQHVLNGPPLKTHKRMKEEALRDPRLHKTIHALAKQKNKSVTDIMATARKQYDEVASRFDVDVMSVLDWLLRNVWNRIYDGMVVNQADIAKLRDMGRRATLIMVPCHRSHIDYLVLSQVLYWNAMMPPLIAAGINLSFWPLGPLFRYAGAYFIRRSFKGDPLYPAVVKSYIKHMMREGFTQEFFIEGTRSRTGKTLSPKFGILSMMVEGFLEGGIKDVAFVPVGIGYEKIIESHSYARELAGGEKEKESFKALLGATRVLRHKYGRVYVTFEDPISLRAFMAGRGIGTDKEADPAAVRSAVRALGHQIVYGISRCTVVTPTAVAGLALLGHHKRGLPHTLLVLHGSRIIQHIRLVEPGARISPALDADLEAALSEAMNRLAEEGHIEIVEASGETFYRAHDNRRVFLDYYKNNILHFFVPDAILAKVMLSFGVPLGTPIPVQQLMDRALMLSRLLKFEFPFRVGRSFDELFAEAVERSIARGYITRSADGLAIAKDPLAEELALFAANVLANFVEAYLHALRALPLEMKHPRSRRELINLLLDRVRAAYLAGECTRSECINKAVLENVVDYAQDQKLIVSPPEGNGELVAGEDMVARMDSLTRDIARFLPGGL